jgi:hypothetical protein
MRHMNVPGDTVAGWAKPIAKRVDENGSCLVDLEVWLENDRLGVTTTGAAVVQLGVS